MKIGEKEFEKIRDIDHLIKLILIKKKNGNVPCKEEIEDFKSKIDYYKQAIENQLPEFDIETILKIDERFNDLKNILSWHDSYDYLTAIEFEIRSEIKEK